jgi:hypothetical protein
MKISLALVTAALCLTSGCGCGNRALPIDGDAGTDAGLRDGALGDRHRDGAGGDGTVPPTCDAQDARPAGVCALFLGYAWNGDDCVAINCSCEGTDCDALYQTYGACLGDHVGCLPPTGCDDLDPMQCEATAACRLIWYGGGCVDTTTCTFNCSGGNDCICYERGYACVPADPACIDRLQAECSGACFWESHSGQICFETCCVDEGWGYCRGREAPASCTRQQINYCSDPCMSVAGVWWSGEFCQPIVCCCEGADCNQTWSTWQACLDAHRECTLNACAATGGYCDYGDAVIPTCLEGYGKDFSVAAGTCGLGVCCAPCPVDGAAGVSYVSHDPSECARIDYTCATGWVGFDNECGCGCLLP